MFKAIDRWVSSSAACYFVAGLNFSNMVREALSGNLWTMLLAALFGALCYWAAGKTRHFEDHVLYEVLKDRFTKKS